MSFKTNGNLHLTVFLGNYFCSFLKKPTALEGSISYDIMKQALASLINFIWKAWECTIHSIIWLFYLGILKTSFWFNIYTKSVVILLYIWRFPLKNSHTIWENVISEKKLQVNDKLISNFDNTTSINKKSHISTAENLSSLLKYSQTSRL